MADSIVTPSPLPGTDPALFKRFMSRVNVTDGCWLWIGGKSASGYGFFGRKSRSVHRVSFEFFHGPIPAGLLVCHSCDVRLCVRPDHLWVGTYTDNVHDAMRKGRAASGDRTAARLYPERMAHGEHHGKAKLTEAIVREIRASAASGVGLVKIAIRFQTSETNVRDIVKRRTWRHLI